MATGKGQGPANYSASEKRLHAGEKAFSEQSKALGFQTGIKTLGEQKRARCACGGHKFKNSRPEKLLDGSLIRRCTRCNLPIA